MTRNDQLKARRFDGVLAANGGVAVWIKETRRVYGDFNRTEVVLQKSLGPHYEKTELPTTLQA